ncbi:insulinase family protein [Mucilaginibacter sp. 14171R-50]|uniref:M16 family metallopeptidase n=1 Tax=Mucilaginibacter sp. 14171R-50 TaxID=2703789 RepID=UPI00138C8B57|nr:pitrilysin family protein [Mucilaginibacter sp. 14171R-50]QHS57792.1 insulinase family protein [Mucilaginibacter sp. 14171R-50]
MKKYIYLLLIAAATTGVKPAFAQQKAYEMMVDGVKVIVQPSGNDIVEIQTVIKGGVQNYPATKIGIESMAFNALTECGTLKHSKNEFKNQLDKISAAVYGGSNKNFSVLKLNCIKSDLETAWPLYVEAITIPKFDAKEFERIKQDAITNLKAQDSDPDYAIDKYADKVAFAGRDYAKDPSGTPETIQKLTAEETKAYYHSILTKSRMLIVVVADLDRADIEAKVKGMLTGIKQGAPFELKKSFFRAYKNTFSAENRELATNYVEGITSGPAPGTPDFDAFNVAMRIFADKHFLDVRTNNGLSYAPQSWFSVGATSVAKFSVSTTEPDKYIKVFDKLVDRIKSQGFNAAEVADMKVTYLTGFYYKNETNSAQASSIASNEVLHNNWKRSLTLAEDVKKLTPQQVSDAFRKYIGNIIWVYQGDTKKVNPLLFTNGTLNKGDNPVTH